MRLFGKKDKDIARVAIGSLLLELVLVTVVTVLLIKVLRTSSDNRYAWFAVPSLLIAAAMIPTALRRRSLADIGLLMGRPGLNLWVLCISCLILLPVLLGGVLLFKHYHVQLPLCPIVPKEKWLSWLIYQFLYVALAEETFFRGYLQSNILRLLTMATRKKLVLLELLSVILAAAIFALSHSVILGGAQAALTFFPGLIFGWLFIKTKSLVVPTLFHGLANSGYGFIAMVLA